jgi:hypothetical protein
VPTPVSAPATTPAAAPAEINPANLTIDYQNPINIPYQKQILKKQPTLDGTLGDNEWDKFIKLSEGPITGTVYMNWDDNTLYVAASTDQPAWFLFDLDCNGDGWLHGADNLEIVVPPANAAGNPPLTARILDAASMKDSPVWNTTVIDPQTIKVVKKENGNGQIIEMAIPKGIAGLAPRANADMRCRADFLPAEAAPVATAPYIPHVLLDINLVNTLTVSAPGITPKLTLDDYKVIPGQILRANLELSSQLSKDTNISSVTWQGEGPASNLLNTLKVVNVPVLKPLKTIKLKYSSPLPETAIPGFYQFSANALLDNGNTVSGTLSFAVVEPFQIELVPDPESVSVSSVGATMLKANVSIYSAVPGGANGTVEIDAPTGWQVKGRSKKGFEVDHEDSTVKEPFYILIPNAAPSGDYILNAQISWHNKTWRTRRSIHVTGLSAAPAAAPATSANPSISGTPANTNSTK